MPAPTAANETMNDALRTILDRLDHVRQTSTGWQARCPAHDDRSPSLSVGTGDTQDVVLHCHAGCRQADILDALGLQWADVLGDDGIGGSVKRKASRAPKPTPPVRPSR